LENLGDAILSFIRNQGFENRIKEADVIRLWKEVVGEKIAEKTKPAGLRKGVLIISVEDSSWRNELIFMGKEIIDKLNQRVGKKIVKKIIFR